MRLITNQERNAGKACPFCLAEGWKGVDWIQNIPIRPLINYTTAPNYKIAKKLQQIIKDSIKLENIHNVKNTFEFINKIKDMEITPSYKLVSMDIVNLYTNIPVLETLKILKVNLTTTGILNKKQIDELLSLLQIIVQQNYYTHDNKYFNQEEGLAMGSPLSGLLAEIYMNYYENKFLLSDYN